MRFWPFGKTFKDPELLIKDLQNPDTKVREQAFKDLLEHNSDKADSVIYGTLEAYSELPTMLVIPLIEIAEKRHIEECVPIFKACLLSSDPYIRDSAFDALVSTHNQDSLDALISVLNSKDQVFKQRVRGAIIEHFGRKAMGALIRAIPADPNSSLYFEIVSIMEDLDLFTLIKENFKSPDPMVKGFYFDTLLKFNRTDFLPLYIEYYSSADLHKRTQIEGILSEYTVPELIESFKSIGNIKLDELSALFDKTVLNRVEPHKEAVLGFLQKQNSSPYRKRLVIELFQNADESLYDSIFVFLDDESQEIRSSALSTLNKIIDDVNQKIKYSYDDNPNSVDKIKKSYSEWVRKISSIIGETSNLSPIQSKIYRQLFFSFVKYDHNIINNYIQYFFQNNFTETYNYISEWNFEEQADLYKSILSADPSFGALFISGMASMGHISENMWRIAFKLYLYFPEHEDAEIYMKALYARYKEIKVVDFLHDKDPEIRRSAIAYAVCQKPGNLLELLKNSLQDFDVDVRLKALNNLETTKFIGLSKILKDMMNDPDEEVALRSAEIFRKHVSAEEFASAAAPFMNSPFKKLKEFVSKELTNFSKKRFKENYDTMSPEMRRRTGQAIQKIDSGFDDQIVDDLMSFDANTRLKAVNLLGNLEVGEKAKSALLHAMKDPSKEVRAAVVKTLGQSGDPDVIKSLIGFFNDPDPRVRANTVEAVASLGDRQVVKFLLPYVNDENNRIKGNAIVAIKKLGNYNVLPLLKQMLNTLDRNMKATAIWAMGEIQDVSYLPFIYPFMNDPDELVRFNAAKAVSRIDLNIFASYYMQQMRKDPSSKIRRLVEEVSHKVI